MEIFDKIFIAGHRGLVGSAIVRNLESKGYKNLIVRTRQELDLLDQAAVHDFFRNEQPDYVIHAAGKVGGIVYNDRYQADFAYENLAVGCNVIHAAALNGTKKLLYLGSSCIYPRSAKQPIDEDSLLTGPLEPTNEGYAIAKIACLKLCEKYFVQYGKNFISVMPTNLYGPGDNYHSEHSHVIPGMMRRFHEAKLARVPTVKIWGTGLPRREFLYVDDLASAITLLMREYNDPSVINVGTGEDITIGELANTLKDVVGFNGEIVFDPSRPDGIPRKVLNVSKIRGLGWRHTRTLADGLHTTYQAALKAEKL